MAPAAGVVSGAGVNMNAVDRLLLPRLLPTTLMRWWLAVILAAATGGHVSLVAHDMWIEPTSFSPATGDIIGARLRVGQDMIGDPLPHDATLINQFVAD